MFSLSNLPPIQKATINGETSEIIHNFLSTCSRILLPNTSPRIRSRQHLLDSYTMAPGLIETPTAAAYVGGKTSGGNALSKSSIDNAHVVKYVPGRTDVRDHEFYEHTDLLPTFPDLHWAPLSEVPYHDKGVQGHPEFRNLLAEATDIFDYNPKIGTEIHGVNLAKLTSAQKDDLARLISFRGVVFFRDQTDLDIDAQRELGQYFGQLHKHATTSVPSRPGLEDVHVVYTDEKSKDQRSKFTPTFLWHSDVPISSFLYYGSLG